MVTVMVTRVDRDGNGKKCNAEGHSDSNDGSGNGNKYVWHNGDVGFVDASRRDSFSYVPHDDAACAVKIPSTGTQLRSTS